MKPSSAARAGALLLIALLTLGGCASDASQSAAPPPAAAATPTTAVRVIAAGAGALTATRSTAATLTSATDSAIVAEASGRVLRVLKRAGQRVAAGEVVLTLENAALRSQRSDAQLNLQTARVNLQTATRQTPEDRAQAVRRVQAAQNALGTAQRVANANSELYKLGGVSGIDLRASQTQERQALVELEAAKSALARLERSGSEGLATLRLSVSQASERLAQLETELARANVKAPFAGEIAELFTEVGEFAAAGAKVFRLVDPLRKTVSFSLPAGDAERLGLGSELSVIFGTRRLKAKLAQDARVPGENRLVRLKARVLSGQDQTSIALGAVGRLEYPLLVARGTLTPSGALRSEGERYFVFVVKNARAGRVFVQVLGEAGGRVALSGLPADVKVVYPVPLTLEPGAKVQVISGSKP